MVLLYQFAAPALSAAQDQPSLSASAPEHIQEAIEETLAQRHPKDTAQWWRSLGPGAPPIIIRMYEESKQIFHRVRLLQGLGWFDDPVALEFIKKQGTVADADSSIRNTVVKTVGVTQGVRELAFVSDFLKHPNPQTRWTAADVLRRMHDPRAEQALAEYLKGEKVEWIVSKVLAATSEQDKTKAAVLVMPVALTLSKDFEGVWTGFWVFSKKASSKSALVSEALGVEIKSVSAVMKIFSEDARSGKSAREFQWENLKPREGSSTKFSGVLIQSVSPLKKYEIQGELTRETGQLLLEFRSPTLGMVALLTRDTKPN